MTNQKKLWTLFTLGGAILALFLLAAGLSGLELLPGHRFLWSETTISSQVGSAPGSFELSPFWKVVIAVVFWVLFPWSLLYVIFSASARKRVLRDIVWVLSFLVVLYLLARALQQFAGLPQRSDAQAPGSSAPIESPPNVAEFISNPPAWLAFVISLILIVLVLGVIWYFWKRSRRHENPLQLLVQEAHEALHSLRAGRNWKDTVVRCYREMSRTLSEHKGLRRPSAMTPREFEEHLQSIGLRDEHIQRLTRLFEEVRYGAKTSDERKEREAALCLEAIVQAYGRST